MERVEFMQEVPEEELDLAVKAAEIKAKVAEQVREDSAKSLLTADLVIVRLDNLLLYGAIDLVALLGEMSAEEPYADIKAITTGTGLVFAFSDRYITPDDAAIKAVVEEGKAIIAGKIRGDSQNEEKLTPLDAIYGLAPDTEREIIDALLKEMQTEERFADLKTVNVSTGEAYFHSDIYLRGSYAVTLLMAMEGDHSATIAKTVRNDSQIYPRTTNTAIFRREELFGIPAGELDAAIAATLRKPECADIKKIVHPETGGVHLYSDRYIRDDVAWAMMEWDEVGRFHNE